jgi:1-acyl-sn-glycerol-3-phosphate acyltransferase
MSYKNIPVFSTILRRMHVLVDITSMRAAARSLAKMVNLARNKKRHVLIFPEGGRFTDGKIRSFFGGFVILARKLKRPVVPIYIRNAHHILNPTGYMIDNTVPLEIEVGPAFELQADETDAAFSERVRAWFCEKADAGR